MLERQANRTLYRGVRNAGSIHVARNELRVQDFARNDLRVERYKEPLVKDHAAVAIGHADLRIWRLPIYELCGGHVAWVEIDFCGKPDSCTNPHYESCKDESFGSVAETPITRGPLLRTSWGSWRFTVAFSRRCVVVSGLFICSTLPPCPIFHIICPCSVPSSRSPLRFCSTDSRQRLPTPLPCITQK
jgi:hypothetical protein